jgi:uncharacterized membrane protein
VKETPALFLAAAYWLHMLATVAWLGGLSALALIVLPSAQKSLDAAAYSKLLGRIQERLQLVGWLSLSILGATGMFQMSANPHYNGFLAIDNPWAVAMFAKHMAVLVMVVASAYGTWGLLPALRRLALLRAAGKPAGETEVARLARREKLLLSVNLVLSILVLALTAWARSA